MGVLPENYKTMSKEKETLDGELEEITEQNSLGDTCATDKVDYEQIRTVIDELIDGK